jgi:O-6-methylguanine DNA methyltransferase
MKTIPFQTTWGTITLTLDGDQVVALDLPHLAETPREEFAFSGGTRPPGAFKACAERPLHLNSFQSLEKKFPKFGTLQGTAFQKSVWRELKKIPRGQTRTYGEIAAAIGKPKAVRAVGSACGANPLPVFIPCHRVVAKTGLGGFGSGLPWKKLLLEMEGWNGGRME